MPAAVSLLSLTQGLPPAAASTHLLPGCLQVAQDILPVVAGAVLQIAVQQANGGTEEAGQLAARAVSGAFGVDAQSVLDMAWQLRQVLQNDTVAISSMRCLKVYMERMGCG